MRLLITALLFWALAIYGAITLVWQSVQRLRRNQHPHPVKLILIVQNAEREIEGVIRTLLIKGSMGTRDHGILILDLGSTDDTEKIVQALAARNSCITYQRIADDKEASMYLSQACFDSNTIGCIYDLRVPDMAHDISRDAAWLCR